MNKVQVRCWKVNAPEAVHGHLLITYPEGHCGHSLLSCLSCGEVYAAAVAKETYVAPIKEQLKKQKCLNCGKPLSFSASPYPERFRDKNGNVCDYIRDTTIPNDEESLIVELPDIYS